MRPAWYRTGRNIGLLTVLLLLPAMMAGCDKYIEMLGAGAYESDGTEESSADTDAASSSETGDGAQDLRGDEKVVTDILDNPDALYVSIASEKGLGPDAIVGAAVNRETINDEKLMELVHTHFNAVTLENELKMDCMLGYSNAVCPDGSIHDEELNGETIQVPTLDHSRADEMLDKILAWNSEHPGRQLRVRGHVLVWHSQAPEWFFREDYDASGDYVSKEVLDKRLEWYIKSMLEYYTGENSRYKGLFYGWDVVNEAVSDATGSYRTDTELGDDSLDDPVHSIKSTWWHVYRSNEFILNAFRYANKYAAPEVELYYNDYNECVDKKSAGIAELLQDVKNAPGTRIDGFGMQGHYSVGSPSAAQFDKALRKYGEVVGKVMLTEFDLKATEKTGDSDAELAQAYEKQAEYLGTLYEVMKQAGKDGTDVGGITTWGVIDSNSWLQTYNPAGGGADGSIKQYPLLFDGNYEPKPAFYSLIDSDE